MSTTGQVSVLDEIDPIKKSSRHKQKQRKTKRKQQKQEEKKRNFREPGTPYTRKNFQKVGNTPPDSPRHTQTPPEAPGFKGPTQEQRETGKAKILQHDRKSGKSSKTDEMLRKEIS